MGGGADVSVPDREMVTQEQVAERYGVTVKTVRNWIARGIITGYRMPGGRLIRIDLNEVERAMTPIPTVRGRVTA